MIKMKTALDLSGLEKIKKYIKRAEGLEGRAGFDDSQKHPRSETPLSDVAYYNHFGSDKGMIPPRPFFDQAATDSAKRLKPLFEDAWYKILSGKYPKPLMEKPTDVLGRYISDVIRDNSFVKNRPSTIAKKGFDDPLTETGTLADSVKTKVVNKDGET